MKMRNKAIMNSVLAGVIAMGFGTTGAFADDGKTKATTGQVTVADSVTAAATVSDTSPVLLPGHPFYFLKMFIEKIEVVLKANDIEKAKLLAEQAEERLKEAEALFAEGKADLAMETLNSAMQTQDRAVVTVIDTKAASEAARKVENGATSTQTVHDDDDDDDEDEDEAEDRDEDKVEDADDKEVKIRLKHNIEALTKALEHVKNPTARAALARNIEKTLEKALKAGEWSEEADDAQVSIEISLNVAGAKQATGEDHDGDTSASKAAAKAAHEQAKAQKKAAHEQAKAAKKAAHEQAKAAKKAAHEQAKAEKKAGH